NRRKGSDPNSLSSDLVTAIYEDRSGALWIGTFAGGLNKFEKATGRFTRYQSSPDQPGYLSGEDVRAILEDRSGTLWVGTNAGLNKFDKDRQTFVVYKNNPKDPHSLSHNFVMTLHEDEHGFLWIGTRGGFNKFDPASGRFIRYVSGPGSRQGLTHNVIRSFFRDRAGAFWIGTDNGLTQMEPKTGRFAQYLYQVENPQGLSSPRVYAICEDRAGAYWVGTWGGGVNRFDRKAAKFRLLQHDPNNPFSLSVNSIQSLYEDRNGIVWIGTSGGGLNRLDRSTGKITCFQNNPRDRHSLSDNIVSALGEDRQGALWIGTFSGGLNKMVQGRNGFIRYQNKPEDPASLSNNDVRSILLDSDGTLWIGTFGGGLNRFDPATGKFVRYQPVPNDPASLSSRRILCMIEDRNKQIWIGTYEGLNKLERVSGRFVRFRYDPGNPSGLSHDQVRAIYEDSKGLLWISTANGLNQFDPTGETFIAYGAQNGLPNDSIGRVLEDQRNRLWISTQGGISRFDPAVKQFRNYDAGDGLQSEQFQFQSGLKTGDGEMFFGGPNGLNAFYAEQIVDNPYVPPVALTGLEIFNKPAPIGGKESPLQMQINEVERITLAYKQSVFSFEFAALNYRFPEKNQYAYKLEGFDREWNYVDSTRRLATYTSLPPGNYVFRVKASNNDGVWNEEGKAVRVTILPPWWRTWWAYLMYGLFSVGLVAGIVHMRTQSQARILAQKQKELDRERLVTERLQRLDELKDEFLVNTSHELRTPLHGIIGLTESLISGAVGPVNAKVKANLRMVVSNSKRLSNLIDDVLDWSRLKHKEIELKPAPLDIRSVAEVVLAAFRPLIGNKELQLINAVPSDLPLVTADETRVQQILYNLIGNAVKFTDHGSVTVSATHQADQVSIAVRDTGIGISAEQLDQIFDAFTQLDFTATRKYGGVGLGLGITKQLVELHGGSIRVESVLRQGSCFTFYMPVHMDQTTLPRAKAPELKERATPHLQADVSENPDGAQSESGQQAAHILVVDDEPVNLQVVRNYLSLHYFQITTCSSGPEALAAVQKEKPDLILLDLMMPRMSGYEVSRKLRETYNHIELPILMLTVKNHIRGLINAFDAGVNDYLIKPFEKDELLVRVNALLALKQSQEALGESEKKYRSLFEKSRDAIYMARLDGFLLDYNRAMMDLLGYTRKETEELDLMSAFANPDEKRMFREQLEKEGAVKDFEIKLRRKDGREIDCLQSAAVWRDKDGMLLGYQGFIRDITERKRLESQLVQAQKMEAIGTLAGGIAHDFNNIVGIILGYTEIALMEASEESPMVPKLQEVLKAGERARDLIRQILAFSARSEQDRRPVNIGSIARDVVKLLRASLPSTIEIRQDIDKDAGPVLADPTQIHQVLMNLGVNAGHAMRQKGGVLSVALARVSLGENEIKEYPDLQAGTFCKLTVQDTGSGIDPAVIDRIFEPYFTTKGPGEGTGLGLAVVHGIVKGHKGSIRVQSEPGKGAVFEVLLAVVPSSDRPQEVKGKKLERGNNERILLVDDEPLLLDTMEIMLRSIGYRVTAQAHSAEAMQMFQAHPDDFDLVITDQTMPEMTGVELARALLQIKATVPIILCTGFSELVSPDQAKIMGVREFLYKPIGIHDLARIVKKALESSTRSKSDQG
ncbi:MAG: response regulator, partial [Desulfobacteraceae bacterium]